MKKTAAHHPAQQMQQYFAKNSRIVTIKLKSTTDLRT